MDIFVLLAAFLFGAILGSFLNVVAYRLHTNRTLGGRSHCLSCGHRLHWYELVPLFSFVAQRGRCRSCGARIALRYIAVEVLTGLLFLGIVVLSPTLPLLFLIGSAAALLVIILIYDIEHTIIPDEIVLLLLVPALGIMFYQLLPQGIGVVEVLVTISAAFLAAGFFAALWLMSAGRWVGLGDAKLAFPLALMTGPLGAFSLVVLAFWIGAVVSVCLLLLQRLSRMSWARGKLRLVFPGYPLTMKSEVPFAPFLIASFFLVYLCGVDVFALIATLIPVL